MRTYTINYTNKESGKRETAIVSGIWKARAFAQKCFQEGSLHSFVNEKGTTINL